ncbi:hypothetical protein SAMN05720268_2042 [Polaribacter sp. KT 15]|nr:hypothetical protein SAMN05720268_2042 [Polaribacter sp. KT 15]
MFKEFRVYDYIIIDKRRNTIGGYIDKQRVRIKI